VDPTDPRDMAFWRQHNPPAHDMVAAHFAKPQSSGFPVWIAVARLGPPPPGSFIPCPTALACHAMYARYGVVPTQQPQVRLCDLPSCVVCQHRSLSPECRFMKRSAALPRPALSRRAHTEQPGGPAPAPPRPPAPRRSLLLPAQFQPRGPSPPRPSSARILPVRRPLPTRNAYGSCWAGTRCAVELEPRTQEPPFRVSPSSVSLLYNIHDRFVATSCPRLLSEQIITLLLMLPSE
jgi:hypothetical protein